MNKREQLAQMQQRAKEKAIASDPMAEITRLRAEIRQLYTRTQIEAEVTKCNEYWEQYHQEQTEALKRQANELYEAGVKELRNTFDDQYFIAEKLTKIEVDMLMATVKIDALAAIVEGQPLIDGLSALLPQLETKYQELEQHAAELGMMDANRPSSMIQAEKRILAIRQAIDLKHPHYDNGEMIHELALQIEPIFAGVYQAVQKKQQEAEQQTTQARQEAKNKGLKPVDIEAKRRNGLMKYGIILTWVHDEYKGKKAPAARYLITTLKNNAVNLNPDEAEALIEFELAMKGNRFDQRLQEIMAGDVEPVEWREPRTVAI